MRSGLALHTPTAARTPAARRPRRPHPAATLAPALALFLALLTLLAWQLRAGHDPVLGARSTAAAPTPKRTARRAIVSRAPAPAPAPAPVVTRSS